MRIMAQEGSFSLAWRSGWLAEGKSGEQSCSWLPASPRYKISSFRPIVDARTRRSYTVWSRDQVNAGDKPMRSRAKEAQAAGHMESTAKSQRDDEDCKKSSKDRYPFNRNSSRQHQKVISGISGRSVLGGEVSGHFGRRQSNRHPEEPEV